MHEASYILLGTIIFLFLFIFLWSFPLYFFLFSFCVGGWVDKIGNILIIKSILLVYKSNYQIDFKEAIILDIMMQIFKISTEKYTVRCYLPKITLFERWHPKKISNSESLRQLNSLFNIYHYLFKQFYINIYKTCKYRSFILTWIMFWHFLLSLFPNTKISSMHFSIKK